MKDLKYWLILVFFLIFFWFLLSYRLTDVPPGINGDEATLGLNALFLSHNLRDETGRFLPIFISAHDGKDWKPPVSMYTTVIFFKLFGPSYFVLRSVSVFLILLSGFLLFITLKNLLDIKLALLGLLIFMTIPAVIIQSHLALENIAVLPFVILWIFMLIKYQKNEKNRYLVLSGISLGVGMYSYGSLRLMVPIFAFLTVFYILKKRKIPLSGKLWRYVLGRIAFFTIGLLPFILFFLVIKKEYPGALGNNNRPTMPQSYQEFLLPYLSSYDLSFLFIKGDSTPYHSTGTQGVFLLATLPLFFLGIYKCLKKNDPILNVILAAFLTAPLLFGLISSVVYRGSRLLAILPLYTIITTVGIKLLLTENLKFLKRISLALIIILIFLNFFDFMNDYWFKYPERVNQHFEKPIHKVYQKVYQVSRDENLKVLIQEDIPLRNPYAYSFLEQSYFPKGLERWKGTYVIPRKSLVIITVHVYNKVGVPKEIEVLNNGSMDLILLINRSDKDLSLNETKK